MSNYEALVAQLKTVAGLPDLQLMNEDFDPKGKDRYIRAWLMQAESKPVSIGANGKDAEQGIFQIDLFTRLGLGDDTYTAELIRDAFSLRGLRLPVGAKELLINKAWIGGRTADNKYLNTTINVTWEAL